MLSDEVIEKVIERLVNRIEEGNTYVLKKIGQSLNKIGTLSSTSSQELIQILQYGGDYDKIVEKLSEITRLNINDIYDIFEEVAKNDYNFSEQFYKYRNKKFIPYDQNIALKNQVEALASITSNEYVNLTKTSMIGFSVEDINGTKIFKDIQQSYIDALDKAVLNVSQGKTTFQSEIDNIVKQYASSGLKTVDYESGRSIRMDSAVRMQLKGALRNLHNEMQEIVGRDFNSDGVEISVHLNPAPDHAEVQGRQFSNEEFNKFQNDIDAVDYKGKVFPAEFEGHDRRSISEYNCYHYVFSIILGVSQPEYNSEQLQEIIDNNNKGFEFDGRHYTNYEGTQLQRRIETEIRKQKDIQIMAKETNSTDLIEKSQNKISDLTKKYKELSETSGLPTKLQRMKVSRYRRTKVKKEV